MKSAPNASETWPMGPDKARMTEDEFFSKYRGRFLLFLTEAWACRARPPTELGMLLDGHTRQLEALLRDIHKKHVAKEPANGQKAIK